MVGVEKIGSPDGGGGRGVLRGKSRPCLYRFCILRTHVIELKGEEDDRRHVDDRLSRCSIAMDGQ